MAADKKPKKYIQGEVGLEEFEQFEKIVKEDGRTQKKVVAALGRLWVKMEPRQRNNVMLALSDESAFRDFVREVDAVVARAILAQLTRVSKLLGDAGEKTQ